jgi:gamma-glutamyltranspeptidase/glutathione hydrolase
MCEPGFDAGVLATLRTLGHDIEIATPNLDFGFGGAQLIQRLDQGGYAGGSDPRKDGGACGF